MTVNSICELQADAIVRRYPSMRVAIQSLRLSWSVPSREAATRDDSERRKNDLHERFFITAPDTASDVPTMEVYEQYWKDVPIKEGKDLSGHKGFFDCSKAERLLGWVHRNPGE
ncbi:hypothetical protein GSI_02163 [Ganoderma sinense ZZ0214-1]|uniref:Uncharacterized protein n=1 Tax=Ganoderma sinense ZZ0214-1 TaxID=1077348 RepID=A0A2G8SNT0_9APHY|nr:hypothetical protein GSI_02163 [Ganoderma sinense ZZ0214-1]